MGRGDSSMPSVVMSSKRVSPDKARVSPWRVAPTVAGRVESLWERMSESTQQVEGLFESMLSESFGGE